MPLEDVVAEVENMLSKWQVQVTHPRYFGLFNPSVTLASVVADTLVAMYNPQLANWRTSPAGKRDGTPHPGVARRRSLDFPPTPSRPLPAAVSKQISQPSSSLSPGPFPNTASTACDHLAGEPAIYLTERRITASTRSRT